MLIRSLPGHDVGGGLVAHRGRVDTPVALWKLSELNCVVTHRRQAVAAGLPRQQHVPCVNIFLKHDRATRGLRTSWRGIQNEHWAGLTSGQMNVRRVSVERLRCVTSFLRGDHQRLSGLAPALSSLRCDAEHVDGLGLEVGHRVLASAGVQHVHRGCVAIGGIEVVCDLVGWRQKRQSD